MSKNCAIVQLCNCAILLPVVERAYQRFGSGQRSGILLGPEVRFGRRMKFYLRFNTVLHTYNIRSPWLLVIEKGTRLWNHLIPPLAALSFFVCFAVHTYYNGPTCYTTTPRTIAVTPANMHTEQRPARFRGLYYWTWFWCSTHQTKVAQGAEMLPPATWLISLLISSTIGGWTRDPCMVNLNCTKHTTGPHFTHHVYSVCLSL